MVRRYLNVMPLDDVLALLSCEFSCTPSIVQVPLENAAGRITAAPIFATYSVPEIHLAAMDGIAVVSADTKGASEQHPVTLAYAARVNTGNVVEADESLQRGQRPRFSGRPDRRHRDGIGCRPEIRRR